MCTHRLVVFLYGMIVLSYMMILHTPRYQQHQQQSHHSHERSGCKLWTVKGPVSKKQQFAWLSVPDSMCQRVYATRTYILHFYLWHLTTFCSSQHDTERYTLHLLSMGHCQATAVLISQEHETLLLDDKLACVRRTLSMRIHSLRLYS